MPTTTAVLFPWTNAYSVQIGIIDSQHKVLIDLINDLHRAMMARSGKEQIGSTLAGLLKYTKSHFSAEEGILLSNQYPDFSNHKVEHERFIQTIQDFQGKFQRGEIALTIEVMDFLKDWLSKHIMGVDKKYVPHLHSKGVR
jgi:hemerythrin-like metal-binding protein